MSGSYVRRKKRLVDNYTQVSNTLIRDRRISPKAKGVAVWMLSHSTEYRFSTDAIAEHLGVGVDQVKSAIRELEKYGYLERVTLRDGGRVAGMEYLLDDDPGVNAQVSTASGFSTDGKPASGKTTGGSATDGETTGGKPGGHIEDEVPRTPYEEDQSCMHDEFWTAMSQLVSTPIDRGGRNFVHESLSVAFTAGWTPEALARWLASEVTAAKRLTNPAGFVIARLQEIPDPVEVPLSQREVDERRAVEARRRAELRALEIANCGMCDERGYVGRRVCDHDPDAARRNEERSTQARRELADALAARRGSTGSDRPAAPLVRQQGVRGVR